LIERTSHATIWRTLGTNCPPNIEKKKRRRPQERKARNSRRKSPTRPR
jgi:hypothetical protein